MCFHIILNALILIFILHVILSNVNFNQVFGSPKIREHYQDIKIGPTGVPTPHPELDTEDKRKEFHKSLKFLSEDTDNVEEKDDDFKKKLLSFMKKKDTTQGDNVDGLVSFEKKNVLPILPSNSFTSNLNVPNFESNVLNVQRFYNRNDTNSFDNLSEDDLKKKLGEKYTNERIDANTVIKPTPIPNLSNDVNDNKDPFGRIASANPPSWSYKNEMPMNGGSMGGGIVGFDTLESQFALFDSGVTNFQAANSKNYEVIPHDDLRKPIIYEN